MSLLLDTHALLWWLEGDPRLSKRARSAMSAAGERVLVSAASAWECSVKVPTGKLPQAAPVLANFRTILAREGFSILDISLDHILAAGSLPPFHGDPFDRMLVSQALAEGMPLVSNDKTLDRYGVRRVW
ncbi:MAG: type II toxin-antitoxin system VapC family toxin [Hyphomonadaceae bacterium]